MRQSIALAVLLALPASSFARPYYAAKNGLSCAACHVSPTGGGMRKTTPESIGKLTDYVSLGGDLRGYLSSPEHGAPSTFGAGTFGGAFSRTTLYAQAQPKDGMHIVYGLSDAFGMAEFYGIYRNPTGLPWYVKAGRFYVPYGLALDEPDSTAFVHSLGFMNTIAFDMIPGGADSGVEFGLAPKDNYFLNIAVTNGQPIGAGAATDAKSVTGRVGKLLGPAMLGGTFYRGSTGPTNIDRAQTRWGPMAWLHLGPAVLVAEAGFATDEVRGTAAQTHQFAVTAELDYELMKDKLLGKLMFDHYDPNTQGMLNDVQRYTIGAEWFATGALSVEALYRILQEHPPVPNNQIFLAGHAWF